MSQTILEKSQGELNKIRNDEVAKGISVARDLYDGYVKQLLKEIQDRSKVTIQPEPVDPRLLREEIQGDIENALRPEAGQAPKHHVVQPRNPNLEVGREYTINDLQRYVNNKGREISYNKEQVKIEKHHVANPTGQQNNYVVRSTKQEQSERNANRVQVNENERG